MLLLAFFFCGLWCCESLRVIDDGEVKRVFYLLEKAQRGELCSILEREGLRDAEDIFFLAQRVFQEPNIDSVEVLKCFEETMGLRLADALGPDEKTLLFPAVRYGQLESVKHLAWDDYCGELHLSAEGVILD